MGSLSEARQKQLSFWEGLTFRGARWLLEQEYPEVEGYAIHALSAHSLAQLDLLILTAPADGYGGLTPLSAEERAHLLAFVERGGWLFLMIEPGINNPRLTMHDASAVAGLFGVEVLNIGADPIKVRPVDSPHSLSPDERTVGTCLPHSCEKSGLLWHPGSPRPAAGHQQPRPSHAGRD